MNTETANLYAKKVSRRSIRLKEYGYSQDGAYFITACTRAKTPYFSVYPELKNIVQNELEMLPEHFTTISIGELIVMPNHVHTILVFDNNPDSVGATFTVARRARSGLAPTVGDVIRVFKSLCVHRWLGYIKLNNMHAVGAFWQRNYYEHIIRSEKQLNLVREYIFINPLKWSFDNNNPDFNYDLEYSKKWRWLEGNKNTSHKPSTSSNG